MVSKFSVIVISTLTGWCEMGIALQVIRCLSPLMSRNFNFSALAKYSIEEEEKNKLEILKLLKMGNNLSYNLLVEK